MLHIKHPARNLVLALVLASLLVLTFSLTLSADTTLIPQGSELYSPFVFNVQLERTVSGGDSLIPETVIERFYTPSVRSSQSGKTQYTNDFFALLNESPDDFARLSYFVNDPYIFDYGRFNLFFSLAPVVIDINTFISDNSISDSASGWVDFFPVFNLSTSDSDCFITVNASLTSIDSAGVARDTVESHYTINGRSVQEEHEISILSFFPEFEEGDLIYINEFSITCGNYIPWLYDSYTTGFVSDTFVEPINDLNSPTHIELGSVPLVSILWNSIVDVFQIDLIPGLSLGTILLAIIGLPLLIWFLKLVAGG